MKKLLNWMNELPNGQLIIIGLGIYSILMGLSAMVLWSLQITWF